MLLVENPDRLRTELALAADVGSVRVEEALAMAALAATTAAEPVLMWSPLVLEVVEPVLEVVEPVLVLVPDKSSLMLIS